VQLCIVQKTFKSIVLCQINLSVTMLLQLWQYCKRYLMTRIEKDETDLACIHADFSHAFQSVTKLENNTDLLSQTI
jgi:hypothetical protein